MRPSRDRRGRGGGREREAGIAGQLLTARHVADLLDVSAETILRWTRQGELPAIRLPSGQLRYSAAALDAWLSERATMKAADAAEECDHHDTPTAAHQDTATTLRPVTTTDPDHGVANEED